MKRFVLELCTEEAERDPLLCFLAKGNLILVVLLVHPSLSGNLIKVKKKIRLTTLIILPNSLSKAV